MGAGAGGVPLHPDEAGRLLRPFADAEQAPAAFGSQLLLFEHFDVDRQIPRAVGQRANPAHELRGPEVSSRSVDEVAHGALRLQDAANALDRSGRDASDNRHFRRGAGPALVRGEAIGAQPGPLCERFELFGIRMRHIDDDVARLSGRPHARARGVAQIAGRRIRRQRDGDDLAMLFRTGDNSMSRIGRGHVGQSPKGRENVVAFVLVEDGGEDVPPGMGDHRGGVGWG